MTSGDDKIPATGGLARRAVLGLPAIAALGAGLAPALAKARSAAAPSADSVAASYSSLLHTWCDGLLARQVQGLKGRGQNGGLLCPACGLIHGRSADAVYPLMRAARSTGEARYIRAAIDVQDWSERHVSRRDGSWVNDAVLSDWKGITVFRAVTLAETLHHHGDLLDSPTRTAWTARLRAAFTFLEGFITIDTGNINYPVASAYAFTLGAQVLDRPDYAERGRGLAHAALDYFTANKLLFGEGHPQRSVTPKGRRPVDLGYNVEESLPALALYALHTTDRAVLDATVASLQAHMEFMLPDGAWDNSWGSRNYKWSWWGSRTSDGCQPAYQLLADHDPRFAEVASRNLTLMAASTRDGLLEGGPHYSAHGYDTCIHHTFAHAKALATVVDMAKDIPPPASPQALPRDTAYGLRSFPEVGVYLAAVGPWRATVTDYDFDYLAPKGGGHASGGALSLLYHRTLGPVLAAGMTEYKVVEVGNQQTPIDASHQPLGLRIELKDGQGYTSLADTKAVVTAVKSKTGVRFEARGRLVTPAGDNPPGGEVLYQLTYDIDETGVTIAARVEGAWQGEGPCLIAPVISHHAEHLDASDPARLVIHKPSGGLRVSSSSGRALDPISADRIFNMVPGFEAVVVRHVMAAGETVTLAITAQ